MWTEILCLMSYVALTIAFYKSSIWTKLEQCGIISALMVCGSHLLSAFLWHSQNFSIWLHYDCLLHCPFTFLWPPVKVQNNHISRSSRRAGIHSIRIQKVFTGILSHANSSGFFFFFLFFSVGVWFVADTLKGDG